MITYEQALKDGMEVVNICATKFWMSNREPYLKFSFDLEDMIGYLNVHILVRRYLAYAEERPDFYASIANYRASLYTSCWKACLAHFRQLCAKKREAAFRPGAMVYLDQPISEDSADTPTVENDLLFMPHESMDDYIKRTADALLEQHGCLTSRVFVLMTSKGTTLRYLQHLMPESQADRLALIMKTIKEHLRNSR